MNIVFGKNGQVAQSLNGILKGFRFVLSDECNFENPKSVREFLQNLPQKPQIIINASAYTKVDLAETETEKAMNINANSVLEIANFCKKSNATLFHYSTDYIFSGQGSEPFSINSQKAPQNIYGKTKLAGENFIESSGCNAYILRISWVCSPFGSNFIKTMLNLFAEKEEISVVEDQIGSPTFASNVAKVTQTLLQNHYPKGIYHFTGQGFCSWFEFANEILRQAKILGFPVKTQKINPILTSQYKTPAVRPLNSRLNCTPLESLQKPWKQSLTEVLQALK